MYVYRGKISWFSYAVNESFTVILHTTFDLGEPVCVYWQWTEDAGGRHKTHVKELGIIDSITMTMSNKKIGFCYNEYYKFDAVLGLNAKEMTVTMSNPNEETWGTTTLQLVYLNTFSMPQSVGYLVYTGNLDWRAHAVNEMIIIIVSSTLGQGEHICAYWQWTEDGNGITKAQVNLQGTIDSVTTLDSEEEEEEEIRFLQNNHYKFGGKVTKDREMMVLTMSNPSGEKSRRIVLQLSYPTEWIASAAPPEIKMIPPTPTPKQHTPVPSPLDQGTGTSSTDGVIFTEASSSSPRSEAGSRQHDMKSKVDRYKLETTFYKDHVVHTTYKADMASRRRRVEVKTKWTRKEKIGAGGFGVVWLEEEERGGLRAVKKISLDHSINYLSELKTLAKLADHTHTDLFVQFFGWYEDRDFLYIAMEYIEGGDLSKYMKSPSKFLDARGIASQVLEGLEVLHDNKICHRDLKPQNILVVSLEPLWVKLADFGVSKREKDTNLHTRLGTSGYMAPELQGLAPQWLRAGGQYSNSVDIWAIGCLVHQLLTSEVPFLLVPYTESQISTGGYFSSFASSGSQSIFQQTDVELLLDYCHGNKEFPVESLVRSKVSNEGIDFLEGLLAANPTSRMTATQALKHPWLLQKG